MADQLLPSRVILRDSDAARSPLPGGTAQFVETGTTTPVTITDSAGTPLPNPLTADATGALVTVFYAGSMVLDCIVRRADGTTVETLARIPRFGEATTAASGISYVPTGTVAADNVQDAIDAIAADVADLYETDTAQRRATYGGTANAISLSSGQSYDALRVGMSFRFEATAANTGSATINLDGLGAVACRTITGLALPAGYIRTGVYTVCWYDGTYWVLDRLPESGAWTSGGIDGVWTRFADGTALCSGSYDDSAPGYATVIGNLITRSSALSLSWPFTFFGRPNVTCSVRRNAGSAVMGCFPQQIETTTVDVLPWSSPAVAGGSNKFIHIVAQGRWFSL